jgi:competence protein ComEA
VDTCDRHRVWTYSRRQLVLVLVLAMAATAGIGIGHWRRGHPELAAKLESFDQTANVPETAGPALTGVPATAAPAPSATGGTTDRLHRHGSTTTSTGDGHVGSAGGSERRRKATVVSVDASPEPIDLNRASAQELMRLPGIGPVLAGRIIASRDADGRFASIDDLRRIAGLGPAKIERFRSLVTVVP